MSYWTKEIKDKSVYALFQTHAVEDSHIELMMVKVTVFVITWLGFGLEGDKGNCLA